MFKTIACAVGALVLGVLVGCNLNWLGMVIVTGIVCVAVVLRLGKTPQSYGITAPLSALSAAALPLLALLFLVTAWTTGLIVNVSETVAARQSLSHLLFR